ncbi:MAG: UvrD-helicase domain-containing protein [Prevotella sp.]|nr:UvrD-helicase domain-containing protein [Prevotella sp.]
MKHQLTVYKASAGSGKTFRLAVEYIKLLIDNPTAYKNILAVTFTNKATEEMKIRILSQLYGLWKGLPDSDDYLQKIIEETGKPESTIAQKAGEALTYIIHDYNCFNVVTIDAFFQSVLRNLARELDLTANLRVSLNDEQVESQAVDELIDELSNTSIMLRWIIDYINENIEEDKGWNAIGKIKSFGKTIFNDFYKEEQDKLHQVFSDETFFKRYTDEIRRIKNNASATMRQYAESFFDLLCENGLSVDSLINKERGIASYFKKLKGNEWSDSKCCNATFEKHLADANNWVSKNSSDHDLVVSLASEMLMPFLEDTEKARKKQWKLFVSADLTLRHLNQLRLLGNIQKRIATINNESGCFLLSDTQHFLHTFMEGSDTPFIFEKMGVRLDHIMIDEFQDTSTVQWRNFRVLLQETMSRDTNLIVGDVKQSIYRWRNGDWRLLNNIQDQYTDEQLKVENMVTNFRSAKNIVDFNNEFFKEAAEMEYQKELAINPDEAEQLKRAYADVHQETPKGKSDEGLVRISLLPPDDYFNETINVIVNTVKELKANGISDSEICILVRSNKYIPLIADAFMQLLPDVNIVSDEAFRLDASLAVCTLIQAFRSLITPSNPLLEANLRKAYQRINGRDDLQLPLSPQLLNLPLTDLTNKLFNIFHLELLDDESAYICTFYDHISNFVLESDTDLDAFIEEWDESIHKKTIQSDHLDGIRLISIHKSKGLEFANVIIPFCDWRIEMRNTIWCHPQEEPFNKLPIVPIDYSKKLVESIYSSDYAYEHIQNRVDNLNLLYVAFTRACNNLFVIGQRDSSMSRCQLIQDVLDKWGINEENKSLPIIYEYGQLLKNPEKRKKETQNKFLLPITPFAVNIKSHQTVVTFKQSNKSYDFVSKDDNPSEQSRYIKMGNILHSLFSTIHTTEDLPKALRELESDGILYDNDVSAERLSGLLKKHFANPQIADWFSNRWKLFNECSIISINEDGELVEKRPDRVMTDGTETIVVDFKFGRERQEYKDQVNEYMTLLTKMGHSKVRGYIWYVYNNQIKEVK